MNFWRQLCVLAGFVIAALLVTTPLAAQEASSAHYLRSQPSRDGTGKFYMGREMGQSGKIVHHHTPWWQFHLYSLKSLPLAVLFFSGILIVGGWLGRNSMEYYSADNGDQNGVLQQRMSTGRHLHVSVPTADGRILTAGGAFDENQHNTLSSTELFDPRTGHVDTGTGMIERRADAAAAVIDDSIYVCGGYNFGSTALSSCEQFVSNRWTTITSMTQEREGFAMVAVDGKLFAIGGVNDEMSVLSSVERFDPKNGQWQFISQMAKGRFAHGAAVLNGWIYVCGGWGGSDDGDHADCERYDRQSNRWGSIAPMIKRRDGFNLVTMDGRLYALGGYESDEQTSVESYDPSKNQWTLLKEKLIQPRREATAVVL